MVAQHKGLQDKCGFSIIFHTIHESTVMNDVSYFLISNRFFLSKQRIKISKEETTFARLSTFSEAPIKRLYFSRDLVVVL